MASEDASEPLLGSAAWIGADDYEPGDDMHARATAFLADVKWDALAALAMRLRGGVACTFSDKFSIGHFNIVRRIAFADGVSWVARVRMSELKAKYSDRELLDAASITRIEVASMKFLKWVLASGSQLSGMAKTSIPVPEVHAYSVDAANDIGAPYILMDYIHGTAAAELRQIKNCEFLLYGTTEQGHKFWRQMARIQAELASFTFSRIGSLYYDEETADFYIGPEVETGKGPWASSMDYYDDLTEHHLHVCATSTAPEVRESTSFAGPVLFKHLMRLYSPSGSISGPFRLVNRDFGGHNVLVDDDFTIVGVIDFDGIMAAPIEVVAQHPVLSGLQREPPGYIPDPSRPFVIERIKRTEPKLHEYKGFIASDEAAVQSSGGATPVAEALLSDAASVFQGLRAYGSHQKPVNDMWMEAYVRLLNKYIASTKQQADREGN